jgi:hypothetical protein
MNKKIRFLIENICFFFLVQLVLIFLRYFFFLIAIVFIRWSMLPTKKLKVILLKLKKLYELEKKILMKKILSSII